MADFPAPGGLYLVGLSYMPSLVQTDKLIPCQVAAFSPAENASMAMVELEGRQSTWSSRWWFGNIRRQGKVAYNTNPDYQLFRNVRDFGAMGMLEVTQF